MASPDLCQKFLVAIQNYFLLHLFIYMYVYIFFFNCVVAPLHICRSLLRKLRGTQFQQAVCIIRKKEKNRIRREYDNKISSQKFLIRA